MKQEKRWGQPLWKSVWRFLQKLKMKLPCELAIPLLGTYPKECKSAHTHFYSSAIYNSQTMESAHVSNTQWIDKENVLHILNGVLFSYKEWNYVICRKMGRTEYHHVMWNKSDPERQILHVLSHTWNIYSMYDLKRKKNDTTKYQLKLFQESGEWEWNRAMEGANSNTIYLVNFKNLCKCYSVPPPSTKI
jgi:hypothetical protein